MKRALTVFVAVLALALVPLGSAETSYTDPAGDSQGGPDVTKVAIDGDPVTGMIAVSATVPAYLPVTADALERYVDVWLDTDRNGDTGDPDDGTEYGLSAWNDPSGKRWAVGRWNGSEWDSIPLSPTMSFTRTGDVLRWTVSKADLGGATAFDFYVMAGIWDRAADKGVAVDYAPDGEEDWWTYQLSAVKPVIGKPVAVSAPVAGKRFTVAFPVVRSDDGTPLLTGIATCKTTVAGKTVPHTHTYKSGTVKATVVVPKAAKGKQLKIAVKVTAGTQAATKVVTFKVK
jgi:hypothetical protein